MHIEPFQDARHTAAAAAAAATSEVFVVQKLGRVPFHSSVFTHPTYDYPIKSATTTIACVRTTSIEQQKQQQQQKKRKKESSNFMRDIL